MPKALQENFLFEFLKICLRNQNVFELAIPHMKYTFFPSEPYKEIWKAMTDYHTATNKCLTIGLLSQQFELNPKAIAIISDIKKADEAEEKDIIVSLEEFIKRKMFVEAYEPMGQAFVSNRVDEAYSIMNKITEDMSNFKLKEVSNYNRIIAGFHDKYQERLNRMISTERQINVKVPFGIMGIDEVTYGGNAKGDIALVIADSGAGKSKFLKDCGRACVRRGGIVVHIQAEGSEQEAEDCYQASLLGTSLSKLELGDIPKKEMDILTESLEQIEYEKGEIFLKSFEQFDTCTMADIRLYCQEIRDRFGEIDLLIVDYIDEVDPGDGKKYSSDAAGDRKKRGATAKKFKNICLEFNCSGVTASQANNIPLEKANDPKFVRTRRDISEFKGLIKPFSIVMTFNATEDEIKNEIMRIYMDKLRKYKSGQIISICTNYGVERFYDHARTINMFP